MIYDTITKKKAYTFVDEMPVFPNGELALHRYVSDNFILKLGEYADTQSSFNLRFVIDKDGNLLGARIFGKREIEYGENEKKMIEIFRNSPKWIPGKCDKKNVDVFMKQKIHIRFKQ